MDKYDKGKLKVLIKMILIQRPYEMTANQIADIINSYDFGFRTSITSAKIGRLLAYELSKHDNHFLKDIHCYKEDKNGVYMYYIKH